MSTIHFLNVLEGDCNIIQHDSDRVSVIDVSNAYNDDFTQAEKNVLTSFVREIMSERTNVPTDKIDYRQKLEPDNPINYLKNLGVTDIFRFIITHPDMDHIDGIKDLYSEFQITNTWDTDNKKTVDVTNSFAGYNKEDWLFYQKLRNGKFTDSKRLTYFDSNSNLYFNEDQIKILCPTPELLEQANQPQGDIHDCSYVLLFTPPKANGGHWKILFAGDSHDNSWEYILETYKKEVSDIDLLFAPHHGRDSDRNYEFLKTLKPRVTLFGNASSIHLAYRCYPPIRITNNQAGHVIIDIDEESMKFYVKNFEFANNFRKKRAWSTPRLDRNLKAYFIFRLT